MKTDELATFLATGAYLPDSGVARRRFAIASGWGAFGAMLLMAVFLGVRTDLADAAMLPMFWVKLGFALLVAVFALLATNRLARPGMRLGWVAASIVAPVLAIWALAAVALVDAESGTRASLVLGGTWRTCPLLIAGLSAPSFGAAMWALRGLAPTRLRAAGAAAGLLAGGIGASAYSLHCPELAAPFLAIWYLLGLLIPTAIGAALGPRLLRW